MGQFYHDYYHDDDLDHNDGVFFQAKEHQRCYGGFGLGRREEGVHPPKMSVPELLEGRL